MLAQVTAVLGVALAASALGASKGLRGATALALVDFRNAWIGVGLLMTVVTALMLRLGEDASAAMSRRH